MRRIVATAVFSPLLASSMAVALGASIEVLPTFHASYRVEYRGDRAGTTEIALTYDQETGIYTNPARPVFPSRSV